MNYETFIEHSNHPELVSAVIEQNGGWEAFEETVDNMERASAGAAGGFHGFIYYEETVQFATRNKILILLMIEDLIEEGAGAGESICQVISNFNSLPQDMTTLEVEHILINLGYVFEENEKLIMNALAWFALEYAVSEYNRVLEDIEEE